MQLNRQGAVLLTNFDTVERLVNYEQMQRDAKDPVKIAEKRTKVTAEKLLKKNLKKTIQLQVNRVKAAATAAEK